MIARLDEMLRARAEFDQAINHALTMLAPQPNGAPAHVLLDPQRSLVSAYVKTARRALDRFAEAAHGA